MHHLRARMPSESKMPDDFVAAAKAELARLESSLSADTRFLRWRQLDRTLQLYELTTPEMDSQGKGSLLGRPPSPDKERILRHVARMLFRREPEPVATKDLLNSLLNAGFEIEGTNQINSLSAMLSNSRQFVSRGRSGWVLVSSRLKSVAKNLLREIPQQALKQMSNEFQQTSMLDATVQTVLKDNAKIDIGRDLDVDEERFLQGEFLAQALDDNVGLA